MKDTIKYCLKQIVRRSSNIPIAVHNVECKDNISKATVLVQPRNSKRKKTFTFIFVLGSDNKTATFELVKYRAIKTCASKPELINCVKDAINYMFDIVETSKTQDNAPHTPKD